MYHETESTSQKDRVRWSERVRGGQTVCQAASHVIIHPDGQTTCPVTAHPPGGRGQWPTSVRVCFSETLLKRKITVWKHLEVCAAEWTTESKMLWQGTMFWRPVLHLEQKYFSSILFIEDSLTEKLFGLWTWSISHMVNCVHPRAYKNSGAISLYQSS